MKKTLIKIITIVAITVATLHFTSCSDDEKSIETCSSCKEIEEQFIQNQWMSVGKEFPTAFTCISNGYTYAAGGYLSGTGQYISKRRVVVCK